MAQTVGGSRPEWVSDSLYPFQSRYFAAPAGRMHYLDEGSGVAIVFVHGNPSCVLRVPPSRRQAQGSVPLRRARPTWGSVCRREAIDPRTIIPPPTPATSRRCWTTSTCGMSLSSLPTGADPSAWTSRAGTRNGFPGS